MMVVMIKIKILFELLCPPLWYLRLNLGEASLNFDVQVLSQDMLVQDSNNFGHDDYDDYFDDNYGCDDWDVVT